MFKNKYEIILECVESDPDIYQCANFQLKKKNVDLAVFFLERGGSFCFISKHLRKKKIFGLIAVKNNPNSYQ